MTSGIGLMEKTSPEAIDAPERATSAATNLSRIERRHKPSHKLGATLLVVYSGVYRKGENCSEWDEKET